MQVKNLFIFLSDPSNNISPSWAEVPAAEEIAIEGKSKTLYCMAYGR